ncbi:carbohydrate porin [Novosphingobium umbonatum]|nr:carbohydrate porin [Novosphingobium umbonatum]
MPMGIAEASLRFKQAWCIIAGMALASPALAQSGTEGAAKLEVPTQERTEDAPRIKALTWDASLTMDGQTTFGGVHHAQGVAGLALVGVTVDGQAFGAKGFSANVMMAAYNGPGISGQLGDLQGVSAFSANRMVRPINAWVMWQGDHFGVKAGIMDTNADFDEQNVGAIFLNGSHGMGPDLSMAGVNGLGTNPYSALGVIGFLKDDASGLKLRVGLFDGQPGDPENPTRIVWRRGGDAGRFVMGELDWTRPGWRIAVGGWHHSAHLPTIDGTGLTDGASGQFAVAEGTLLGVPMGTEAPEGKTFHLDAWLRYGRSKSAAAPITAYYGGGLVAQGFWKKFPQDSLGVAVAHARVPWIEGTSLGHETVLEATYQHPWGKHVVLQPNLQYLPHPGGDRERPSALVFGLRVTLLP